MAKFHGDRSRDGGGSLAKEKKETSRAFYKSSRLVRLHVESRVHFVVKASHLCGYVKGSPVFPKMVVGTLENACDSCRKRLNHTIPSLLAPLFNGLDT